MAFVALAGPAQCHAVCACNARQTFRKTLGHFVQRDRVGHQCGDLVQAFQAFTFLVEFKGFFSHFGLQVAVHRLQVLGHAVKPVSQSAKFVAGDTLHSGIKVALLDLLNRLFELPDWLQHKHVAGVQQHCSTQHHQGEHAHLQQMQQGRPFGNVGLNAGDKGINV